MRDMVGIDVGGTFTDLVAYTADRRAVEVWKQPSVPGDPVERIEEDLAGGYVTLAGAARGYAWPLATAAG